MKNGLYQSFYSNGQLLSSCYYIDGKENCLYQSFYHNGKLEVSCNYIDDKRNGLYQSFYSNGQLLSSCYYIDGKENGLYQSFYHNGKLEVSCNYIDDKLNGLHEEFTKKGKLIKLKVYKIESKGFNRIKFYKKKRDYNHRIKKEHLLVYGEVQVEKHIKPEDDLSFTTYYPQFKHLIKKTIQN